MNHPAKKNNILIRITASVIVLGMMLFLCMTRVEACGDFRLPSNHFEGVSSGGYVSDWKELNPLNIGDLRLPLLFAFQTYRSQHSPELGAGWILPLLDSNIVQRDENTFDMMTPDGTQDFFQRDSKNPAILNGSSGWTAEMQGDHIIIHSKCGSGWKMDFAQGKLVSLSKGDHEIRIQRDLQGNAMGVCDGPKTVMTIERDQKNGLMKSLSMGDQKYRFEYDSKPQVQNINGVNLVTGVTSSLHKLIYPDGKSETYDFAVNQKLLPTLKITDTSGQERLITWDTTGHILQDGSWNYKTTPSSSPNGDNAAISRSNDQKQNEYWFKDYEHGQETSLSADGVKTVKTWFTSGLLNGKIRSKEITKNGVTKELFRATYDEKANQVRAILADGTIKQFKFSLDGKEQSMTQTKDGKELLSVNFDDQGRSQKVSNDKGHKEEFKYDEKTNQKLTYVDGKLLYEQYLGPDRQWMQRIVYNPKTGMKRLSVWKEFNTRGQMVVNQISDATGKMPTVLKKYVYDNSGKVVQELNSRLGTINYNYTQDGKIIKKILKQTLDAAQNSKS